MSAPLTELAWQTNLAAPQKIVLLALAGFTDEHFGVCFPTMRTLSEQCGMSMSTVRRQVRALERSGVVETQRQSDGPVYRVKLGVPA